MSNASRYNAFWLVLFAVGSVAACSSAGEDEPSKNNNNTSGSAHGGSAGSLNTGGSPSAAGTGTSGSASAGTGTSGSATAGSSTGGAGGGSGFACAGMKPMSALITEFADLAPNATNAGQLTFTLGVPGGTFAYEKPAITVADTEKALNVKGHVKSYDGFGIYFAACTDASQYTGVSFKIKGNAGPTGKLSFRAQTNATTAVNATDKKGTCVPIDAADAYASCHGGAFEIPVTVEAATISVKWSDLTGGIPVATIDAKDLVGLEWAFAWTGAGATEYDADVTVDDVKLTGGSLGGSGGSGGSGGGGNGGGGTGGTN